MAEHNATMEATLEALLNEKKYKTLKDVLITMNPADVAAIFSEMGDSALTLLFRLLPKEQAAETFVEMEPEAQEVLMRGFSDAELKAVLDELYIDDAVDIVEEMPANVVQRILKHADPEMRKSINEILRYPENSAGSIMTTECFPAAGNDGRRSDSPDSPDRCGQGNHLYLLRYEKSQSAGPCYRQGFAAGRR